VPEDRTPGDMIRDLAGILALIGMSMVKIASRTIKEEGVTGDLSESVRQIDNLA
jgi:hypothetical protein